MKSNKKFKKLVNWGSNDMPYIITFVWYPLTKINQVAERYLEVVKRMPVPSFIKRLVLAASAATKEGIEIINVDEVKKEDFYEGNNYNSKFMLEFKDIEGLRFHIRTFSTLPEAFKDIGIG